MGNGITKQEFLDHREKHGMTYMINFFASILPMLTVIGIVYSQLDTLVLEPELESRLATHETVRHTELEKTVDSIYLLNLQDRIEKLIRAECVNPTLRAVLETEIRGLILQYNSVSDIPYTRPSCEALQAVA